jgi:hypothetical protein
MTLTKALIAVPITLLALVFFLPYTGLLDHLMWRMPGPPDNHMGENIAQRLGFDKNTKLLIVNSDDTGANPTFTHGIERVMKYGLVTSNSIIVHDRNDHELARIATLSKANPEWGFGVHLMLTNEYQAGYPWAPVLSKDVVPTLYNAKGLAWEKISDVESSVDPKQAALEFKAQIQKALDAGIDVTHIDSHMGTYYRQSRFPGADTNGLIQAAIAAAEHFDIPMAINTFDKALEAAMNQVDAAGIIRPDSLFGFYELEEMNSYFSYEGSSVQRAIIAWVVRRVFGFELPYKNRQLVLNDVKDRMSIYKLAIQNVARPGLNHIFMHAAQERHNGVPIPSGLNHKARVDKVVRLSDSAVWSSDEMKAFLKAENIVLINYQRLRDLQQAL